MADEKRAEDEKKGEPEAAEKGAEKGRNADSEASKGGGSKTTKSKAAAQEKRPEKGGAKDDAEKNVRVGAVIAVALALLLVGWLVIRDGDDSSSESESADGGAEITSVESLRERAAERGTPIYWAGEQEDSELEVTETNGGDVIYVRYLTGDAEAGEESPEYLTVGTYAFPNAAAALRQQAKEPGGVLARAPNGGVVYYNRDRPQSVYLAYPGIDLQIEVYDPDPERALNLVTAGQIVPVS